MTEENAAAETKVTKAERREIGEIIDPFVHKATGGKAAVNYDVDWAGTKMLGDDGPGVWRSRPWNRGHGDLCRALYNKLKEMGVIEWDDDCFFFTHEDGMAAARTYVEDVLAGKVKANKRSWGPHYDTKKGRITSRFFMMEQTKEIALEKGFELHAQGNIIEKGIETPQVAPEGLWFSQLEEMYPELYGASTPKAKKVEGEDEPTAEVEEEKIERHTKVNLDDISLDDLEGPVAEELTPEPTMSDDDEDDEDLEEDEDDEAEDEELKTEVTSIAAAATVEAPMPGTLSGYELGELDQAIEDDNFAYAKMFADATKMVVNVKTESIEFVEDSGTETRQDYLVYIPEMDTERWLPLGKHLIGDPETMRFYLIHLTLEDN